MIIKNIKAKCITEYRCQQECLVMKTLSDFGAFNVRTVKLPSGKEVQVSNGVVLYDQVLNHYGELKLRNYNSEAT